jgi:hypothetical protein
VGVRQGVQCERTPEEIAVSGRLPLAWLRTAAEHFPRRRTHSVYARAAVRIAGVVGLAGVGLWAYDKEYNASALRRSLRTMVFGVTLALDFAVRLGQDGGLDRQRLREFDVHADVLIDQAR